MKKFLLMIVVALTTLTANAQIYVGGDLGFWHDDDAVPETVFTLAPGVGYELNEKWAVGGNLKLEFEKDVKNLFAIEPYARWSYYHKGMVKLFLDMGMGIAVTDPEEGDCETGWNIGVKPGIALHLTEHFSILAKAGFLGYADDYGKMNGFGLNVNAEALTFGIEYTF